MAKQMTIRSAASKQAYNNAPDRITIRLAFRCRAMPATWTLTRNGELAYSPASCGTVEFDPWKVRKRFVTLTRDDNSLLSFLNEIGSWDLLPSRDIRDFWEWQDVLKEVLVNRRSWKTKVTKINALKARRLSGLPAHSLTLDSRQTFKSATFSCNNYSVLDAIIASIILDSSEQRTTKPATKKPPAPRIPTHGPTRRTHGSKKGSRE